MSKQIQLRKSGAELPSADEVLAILKKESPRKAVRFDFLSTHSSLFEAHHELSLLAGSDDSWTTNYPAITLEQLAEQIDRCQAKLTRYIQEHNDPRMLYKKLYKSLIPPEDLSKSDVIFVFGAASNARIERAIELYKNGVAPKIIISGHRPFYSQNQESEASRMLKVAIDSGVPPEHVIFEEASITLPDNVKKTLDLLEQENWQPASITIVATNFVLQRALMDWYKFTPWNIAIKTVAAHPQSLRFTEDGWYKDKEATALVLNEYVKLVYESKIDLMRRDGALSGSASS
jgi:hypothetical protein